MAARSRPRSRPPPLPPRYFAILSHLHNTPPRCRCPHHVVVVVFTTSHTTILYRHTTQHNKHARARAGSKTTVRRRHTVACTHSKHTHSNTHTHTFTRSQALSGGAGTQATTPRHVARRQPKHIHTHCAPRALCVNMSAVALARDFMVIGMRRNTYTRGTGGRVKTVAGAQVRACVS